MIHTKLNISGMHISKYYKSEDFIDHVIKNEIQDSHTYYGCRKCGAIFGKRTGFSLNYLSKFSETHIKCKICNIMGHSDKDFVEIGGCSVTILNNKFRDIFIEEPFKRDDYYDEDDYNKASSEYAHEQLSLFVAGLLDTKNIAHNYMKFVDLLPCLANKNIDSFTVAGFILDLHTTYRTYNIPYYAFNNASEDDMDYMRRHILITYSRYLRGHDIDSRVLDNIIDFSITHNNHFPALLPETVIEYLLLGA